MLVIHGKPKRLVPLVRMGYAECVGICVVRKAKHTLCRVDEDRGKIQPAQARKGEVERVGVNAVFTALPDKGKGQTVANRMDKYA